MPIQAWWYCEITWRIIRYVHFLFVFPQIFKETTDPYHTYLAMASLALYPPTETWRAKRMDNGPSWNLEKLDPLLNLRVETAEWARRHIPDPQQNV